MGLSLPDHYHQWRNQDGAFGANASILDPHCGGAILLLIEILKKTLSGIIYVTYMYYYHLPKTKVKAAVLAPSCKISASNNNHRVVDILAFKTAFETSQ